MATTPRYVRLNPKDYAKADIVRHYLRHFPDGTLDDFRERYPSLRLTNSQFYNVRYRMRQAGEKVGGVPRADIHEAAAKKKTAKTTKTAKDIQAERAARSPKTSKTGTPDVKYSALTREIAYLKWLLEGERMRFLDRWLDERDV